ncbi:MAG: GNAT family N-acetyltransferase [Acidobacteriota bacterium]|nr:GNAT family N-acetyltransferase [Acidobacteriota bacterium]
MAKPFALSEPALQAVAASTPAETGAVDWRDGLPVLKGRRVTLRELRVDDAQSLLAMLTSDEITRFISPPPTTVEGFERFIAWTLRERSAGRYLCFAVVPDSLDVPAGLFQVREMDPGFGVAEWGFALASAFWGSGAFLEAAELVLDFTFNQVGAQRIEARAATQNGRGNGALRKLGAVQEGVLRRSFLRRGALLDQNLWAILADEWRVRTADPPFVH